MECFEDRSHAGGVLAALLAPYRARTDAVVLGLPRGGVPIALEVASALEAPLDYSVGAMFGASRVVVAPGRGP